MSLQNAFITKVWLPLTGNKRHWSTTEGARSYIATRAAKTQRFAPPRVVTGRVRSVPHERQGWPVYELTPRRGEAARHVFYLHGGAYVNEIVFWHWWLLAGLVRGIPCRALVPIYPLGARAGAEETVAKATAMAAELVDEVGAEHVVLMGDSAGGGLALAVAQALRDRGQTTRRVVLIAPLLDAAADQPEQRALEPRDAMLALPGVVETARTYARGLPLDDPRVSPLFGEMRGLPPIAVFVGTEDLLNPDSHRLRERCAVAGVEIELIEGQGLPHVYPLYPTPEGRAARAHIARLLRA